LQILIDLTSIYLQFSYTHIRYSTVESYDRHGFGILRLSLTFPPDGGDADCDDNYHY
jgi:hypothetical protein